MKKVGRIVQRQNLKQQNQALKNILTKVDIVAKAHRLLEDAFQRGFKAGMDLAVQEQQKVTTTKENSNLAQDVQAEEETLG